MFSCNEAYIVNKFRLGTFRFYLQFYSSGLESVKSRDKKYNLWELVLI